MSGNTSDGFIIWRPFRAAKQRTFYPPRSETAQLSLPSNTCGGLFESTMEIFSVKEKADCEVRRQNKELHFISHLMYISFADTVSCEINPPACC